MTIDCIVSAIVCIERYLSGRFLVIDWIASAIVSIERYLSNRFVSHRLDCKCYC